MAGGASRLSGEGRPATRGARVVEGFRGRLRNWQSELIEMTRGKLGSDLIVRRARVCQSRARSDRILLPIVQPGVEEIAPAMHLEVGHERVPVRHAAPGARPRTLIDPRQAERRWDQRGGGLAHRDGMPCRRSGFRRVWASSPHLGEVTSPQSRASRTLYRRTSPMLTTRSWNARLGLRRGCPGMVRRGLTRHMGCGRDRAIGHCETIAT